MSNYESRQRRRNITVGIFVIVGVCALFGMIFKFGDLPVIVGGLKSFEVEVQFPTAPGVQKDTPVRFCGYQIGRVMDIKPPKVLKEVNTDRFYHQTVVVLSIDKKYNDIPADVEVKLMTRGLGSSYIEFKVQPPDSNQPVTEFLADDSLLQGSTGMTSEFFPEESQKKLEELVDGIGAFVNNANDVLGDEANKENFKSALANLSEASKRATEALKEFQKFLAAGVDTSEQLSKMVAELRLTLEKINAGEGTAAKFVNDGRLYENLLENTEQMQVLLQELRAFIAKSSDKGLPIQLK